MNDVVVSDIDDCCIVISDISESFFFRFFVNRFGVVKFKVCCNFY